MRSVWSNGFNPAPKKKGRRGFERVERKGHEQQGEAHEVHETSRQVVDVNGALLSGQSRRHNHATNDIQPSHISRGPSRAAQVAAKRYLSGKSSPPNAATCNTDVSLTRKRTSEGHEGATISRWRLAVEHRLVFMQPGLDQQPHGGAKGQPHRQPPHGAGGWATLKAFAHFAVRKKDSPAKEFGSRITEGKQH